MARQLSQPPSHPPRPINQRPRTTAEEQRLLAQKQSNPLRAYLGLSDEEQKRIQKRDALIDRDLYSDLRRCVRAFALCACACVSASGRTD